MQTLPLNPNGKVDRPRLRDEIAMFSEAEPSNTEKA